ncbi:hypothetical protein ACWGTO_27545 [Mesorhizobium sp. PL10]
MSNRYATIITDDDGREVISAIGVFEGAAPQARIGRIELVVAGVLIGMVRGGPVDAIGGFGFPSGAEDGRAIGLARANLKAMPAKRGDAAADAADAASRKAKQKPARAKRRKSGKTKRPAKPAAQAEPVGISDHG